MDPMVKRKVMIGIIVVCVGLALGITVFTRGGCGGGGARGPVQMLCTNPDCGKAFEMSRSDFQEKMTDMTGPGGRMGPMGQMPAFTCTSCGEESAYIAIKCKQCGEVFVRGSSGRDDYPDKCPACGYSDFEKKR